MPKKLSTGALSWQFASRLIDAFIRWPRNRGARWTMRVKSRNDAMSKFMPGGF